MHSSLMSLCFFYAIYLKITKKLPFYIKETLPKGIKDDYLKIEVNYYFQVATMLLLFELIYYYYLEVNGYIALLLEILIFILLSINRFKKKKKL